MASSTASASSGETAWLQGIYISKNLYDKLGREPEAIARLHIEKAFERAGIPIEVEAGHEPIDLDVETERPLCANAAWSQWKPMTPPARNSNICLVDYYAGGCASPGGRMAIAGANRLTDMTHEWMREGKQGNSIHSILHEIAHNAGYSHADATGRVWIKGDKHYVTPSTSPSVGETETPCGFANPAVEMGNRVFYHAYSDCTVDIIKENL